ncbi:P-loop containing nucleoside triphosphate hydrolase protein [Trichoderma sp. SZMC 28014]
MANPSSTKGMPSNMPSNGNLSNISEFADQARGLGQHQLRVLNVIDSLRSAMIGKIELPELVVVGDQSAGKSSVLDAITGIPIPKNPDGCTRFATEFRLRPGSEGISISVGIIPRESRTPQEKNKLSQLSYQVKDTNLLGSAMEKCGHAILDSDESGQRKFASRDIMTIDICGPTMPLLTLVDLPGFIHTPNIKQTQKDIEAIEEIAMYYMKRPRAIILAVVAGGSDYAMQVVLKRARECDEKGARTLGIVTKPDLLGGIGLEEKFLRLVKNEDIELALGWHVLRNRTPHEMEMNMDSETRNRREEEFFSQGKWKTLPPDARGVGSLVKKLSVLLYKHIKDYLPQLFGEIEKEREQAEKELGALSRLIDTESQMFSELSKLFFRSDSLIKSGISGHYSDHRDFFLPRDVKSSTQISSRKLRARIRQENMEFEEEIRLRGGQMRLISKGTLEGEYEKNVQKYLEEHAGQHLSGDYDPLIVYPLFDDYSAKWDSIARDHLHKVQDIVTQFLRQVVDHVWPEHKQARLWSTFLSEKVQVLQTRAEEELERLLSERRGCYPIFGPEYPRRLRELQDSSASKEISSAGGFVQKLLVYYELASQIFISNVIVQVAERHLINGLRTVFDTQVLDPADQQIVTSLAAEDEENTTKRDDLARKAAKLKKARDECLKILTENGQKTV